MSKYFKLIQKVVGALLLLGGVVFIGIQFVPVEQTNPSLPKYLLLHPEARLNAAELQALINELKATFGAETEGAMAR